MSVESHHNLDKLPREAYLNRELAWLEFNERVRHEATHPKNPPLERLKYTAICGSNLDEFFMVRVAGIHRQIAAHVRTHTPDGLTPHQNLDLVRKHMPEMMANIQRNLQTNLENLEKHGIQFVKYAELDDEARENLRQYYLKEVHPVLTPLAVDPSHPFPYISNLSLNLAVILEEDEGIELARVKVPVGVLPRVVKISDGRYMFLEDLIAAHLSELFRGRTVLSSHVFRVTRNTDYEFEEEEAEDLLATIEDGLRRRRFGAVVRLEANPDIPERLLSELTERLRLSRQDVFLLSGPLGVADFMGLVGILSPLHPHLTYVPYVASIPDLEGEEGIFCSLQQQDFLMHHPYESFEAVLQFIEEAAQDPDVLAIKQTLYRTGGDRRLLRALTRAAEAGKQVVALVELKARFDEQRNITWARALERAGIHVVYGLPKLKTHAKVTLVVRREQGGLRRYVHIGTGNYNPRTAAMYTDISFLTSDKDICIDASELFNRLTGYAEATYRKMLVAPERMRHDFYALIDREIQQAKAGQPAAITAKMNSLTDPGLIQKLYQASQAGVQIRLIIRGVCCLKPGVPGLSDNIVVRSIIGRFLEHARIYAFFNAGASEVYIGSADWMTRNLNRRVEVVVPIRGSKHQRYLQNLLEAEWRDTRGSWQLFPDGKYEKVRGSKTFSSQRHFMLKHGALEEVED